MRIRTLLLACIGAVGSLAVAAASFRAADAAMERQTLFEAAAEAVSLERYLVLSEEVALERATMTTLFSRPGPIESADFQLVADTRARTHDAWFAADPGNDPALARARATMTTARDMVFASLTHPAAERPVATMQAFVAAVSSAQAAANRAADGVERKVGRLHAALGRLAGIARLSQNLREAEGMRSSQLSMALTGGDEMPRRFEEIDELSGRIDAIWERMDLAIGQLEGVPAVAAARDKTERTLLAEGESLYRATNRALRNGTPPPFSVADFRAWTMPMLANGLLVRNAALATLHAQAASLEAAAAVRRNIAIVAAMAALTTTLGAMAVVMRRVAEPLTALTSAMVRLAEGDVLTAVPGVTRLDELGAMARAVEVFKSSESKISWMALHDPLTRLPNRTQLRRRLQTALQGGAPAVLLLLDLDRFKDINDMLGHAAGDMLLQAVARRLQRCVRDSDLVARLGGDEFAILLADRPDPVSAGVLSQRLVDEIATPFDVGGHRMVIGTSVGVAVAGAGMDEGDLTRNADQALYAAKAQGRGTFRFHDPEMEQGLKRRREVELELRVAIEEKSLTVHYQPIVDLASNRILAMEGLLRWTHPRLGAVSPGEFIPIAEETGLIRQLGAHVLRTACAEAATWPSEVRLAINLSPVQFQGGDLADVVAQALATGGLAGSRLTLEITEQVLLHRDDSTHLQLRRLRELGARIALDDFGVGYSSLSYLQAFPFESIKIDQSFVRDLARRESARAIVRAIAGLGATLGMSTTAEGVETAEQLAAVRLFGCTEAQGFLFSRAVAAGDVAGLFARQSTEGWPRRTAEVLLT